MAGFDLVADVGGTNTRVALAQGGTVVTESLSRFKNSSFATLEEGLSDYLRGQGKVPLGAACVAVAGPVGDGKATLTNLDWSISTASLEAATGAARGVIINDLQAQGFALDRLTAADTRRVITARASRPSMMSLVVGIGTGFNIAPVLKTADTLLVPAAEAGHAELPAVTDDELNLRRAFAAKDGFASIEHALSGRGLAAIYTWAACGGPEAQGATSQEVMAAAASAPTPAHTKTLDLFVQLLGRVVGDYALTLLPFGGIYFVGGMSRAIAPYLETHGFEAAFASKGRFSEFMGHFTVNVVENDNAALIGAAAHLSR